VVRDQAGKPVAGARVQAGGASAVSGPDGAYALDVEASPSLNVKVLKDGFVLRDASFPVLAGQALGVDIAVVPADAGRTRIVAATGGKAVSADGRVVLAFPPGALSRDAAVRVTWLDPTDTPAPAAYTIRQLDAPGAAPAITELNDTQLPGPLETTAYGDRKFFSPVAFADVAMTAPLAEGASAELRMKVSKEVHDEMRAAGDLADADLGQDIFPCFSWNADGSTWDKPALSKVERDDAGDYWFVYAVRANAMSASPVYHVQQLGDEDGQATVSLVVGGGRRVVDGTFTYSALVERSSDPQYDWRGASYVDGTTSGVTIEGGADWTAAGGHYRAKNRANLRRPSVRTQSYTGTTYGQVIGSENFAKWDRQGMFQLAYAPGDRFEIEPPAVYGVKPTPARREGTTSTAAKPYLPEALSASITQSLVQQQTIPATYVMPFFYFTDCALTLMLTGERPGAGDARLTFSLDGGAVQALAQPYAEGAGKLTFKLPRNAAATPRSWILDRLVIGDYASQPGLPVSTSLPVGGSATVTVKMLLVAPK
jgi:hypothetical protein